MKEETQKYTFKSYYKYSFIVKGEDGNSYVLESDSCNPSDVYRFEIEAEGDMVKEDGEWTIDGMIFEKI